MLILLAIIASVSLTTLGIVMLRPLLLHHGMADKPGAGRSHNVVTARGGGIAILFGFIISACLAFLDTGFTQPYGHLLAFLLGVSLFSILGALDDIKGLPWWLRLGVQILLSVLISWISWKYCGMPGWLTPLVSIAGIFYINAANFMDGINGISAMHGMVTGGFFIVLGYLIWDVPLMIVASAFAAAFATFLPWNSPRARLFMGDSGAYLLGAGVWGMAWWAMCSPYRQAPLLTVISPVLIYSIDVLFTLFSRIIRHENLTERHRDHIFTRFSDKTSHLTSAVVVTMITTLSCVGGLIIMLPPSTTRNETLDSIRVPLGIIVMISCVAAYLCLPIFMRNSENTPEDLSEIGE
ncbi:MAG: glycosyltransferase family 4 protein [Propionibacteriaceae bacterium]